MKIFGIQSLGLSTGTGSAQHLRLSETDYSMTLVYLHCSDWELEVQNQGLTPTLVGLKHYFSFFSYNVIVH